MGHGDHRPTWIIRVQVKTCEARNKLLKTQQYYLTQNVEVLRYRNDKGAISILFVDIAPRVALSKWVRYYLRRPRALMIAR